MDHLLRNSETGGRGGFGHLVFHLFFVHFLHCNFRIFILSEEGQTGANEFGDVPSNSLEGLEAAFTWGQNQPTNP